MHPSACSFTLQPDLTDVTRSNSKNLRGRQSKLDKNQQSRHIKKHSMEKEYNKPDSFLKRHIGPSETELAKILNSLKLS
ncbi:MAG: hypothetical protein OXN83_00555, partial [Oligoflexia bacterium]|nr:hypothetical protein [Oligoflexia bacterium]